MDTIRQIDSVYQRLVKRVILAFIGICSLAVGFIWLVHTGTGNQKIIMSILDCSHQQRFVVYKLTTRINYLFHSIQDKKLSKYLFQRIISDIDGYRQQLIDNHHELVRLNQMQSTFLIWSSFFKKEDLTSVLGIMGKHIDQINRKLQSLTAQDLETIRSAQNLGSPTDFLLIGGDTYGSSLENLSKEVASLTLQQSRWLKWYFFLSYVTLIICLLLIWTALIQPLISEIKHQYQVLNQSKQRLYHQALHDPLTGLSNRTAFNEYVEKFVTTQTLTAIAIDLDKFKFINDCYGHETGDQILITTAKRLADKLPEHAKVFRMGGDEFVAFLEGHINKPRLDKQLHILLEQLKQTITLEDGDEILMNASIGVAYWDQGEPHMLADFADMALYQAKEQGGSQVIYYHDISTRPMQEARQLKAGLSALSSKGEIIPFYQPILNARTGTLAHLEVLARWQHPRYGLLEPAKWMGLQQRSTLETRVSYLMIEKMLEDYQHWQNIQLPIGGIFINTTEGMLVGDKLLNDIHHATSLNVSALNWLGLEITETVALGNKGTQLTRRLRQLYDKGINIFLDDFGTGYSTLIHLRDLPFTGLKIDKRFILNLDQNPADQAIVKNIIHLAHDLGKQVICEGVENKVVEQMIIEMGADLVQGYKYCRPVPAAEIQTFIAGLT